MKCNSCPRNCNCENGKGFCKCKNIHIAKIVYNFTYEEPCFENVVAIFFSGCNLRCEFCQNKDISRNEVGTEYSPKKLAELFQHIDELNYSYIDLITPTHYSDEIVNAFKIYKPKAKIIYNTSGYEKVENINILNDYVDVYLTDAKYYDTNIAKRFSSAGDYFSYFSRAVLQMRKKLDIFENGLLRQGLLIRLLVLPGYSKDSICMLDWIKRKLKENTMISLMSQFTPNGEGELNRTITPLEYKVVINHALKLGLTNGYTQDIESAKSFYTPNFKVN